MPELVDVALLLLMGVAAGLAASIAGLESLFVLAFANGIAALTFVLFAPVEWSGGPTRRPGGTSAARPDGHRRHWPRPFP